MYLDITIDSIICYQLSSKIVIQHNVKLYKSKTIFVSLGTFVFHIIILSQGI